MIENKKIILLEQGHTNCLSTHIDYWEKNFVPTTKSNDVWDGMKSVYCDPVTESLLLYCKPQIEKALNTKLVSAYSFWRTYYKGQSLIRHVDRPSCQISVTLCIDMSEDNDPWDIFVDGYSFKLQRGEAVVYRGFSQEHWRKPLQYDWHRQIFLHYIEKEGSFYPEHKYDRRDKLYTKMEIVK